MARIIYEFDGGKGIAITVPEQDVHDSYLHSFEGNFGTLVKNISMEEDE